MGLLNKKELTSSAEVIDKHLILSLPNAIDPVVWRMALDKIGTASFETKHVKTSDTWKLVLKPKKGTAETIATFTAKDEALESLLQASQALQNPHSTAPVQNGMATAPQSKATNASNDDKAKSYKWLFLFLGFLLVIGLYTYTERLIPNTIDDMGASKETSLQSNTNSSDKSGVPLSADDFLNGM